jgi:formylglycine-generating enzyme
MLRPDTKAAIISVIHSNSDRFTELAELANLNPAADFRRANLRNVDLRNDSLTDYNFTSADLTGADVRGADFRQTNGLDKAILTGVLEDRTTRWPANFRPIGSLVFIPPGRFMMGTARAELRRENMPEDWPDESPRHMVTLARGFLLGRYPVTVGEFRRFVAETGHPTPEDVYGWNVEKAEFERSDHYNWANPGFPQDDGHPVTCVSHEDAAAYAAWLSDRTRQFYRLPTEAEWEYACRAGTRTARFWGDNRDAAAEYANVADRSLAAAMKQQPDLERFFQHDDGYPFTSPLGAFRPNKFGLYDMLGNVWEWCEDHRAKNYRGAPKNGTAYTTVDGNASRVLRGGSWLDDARFVRAGSRGWDDPRSRYASIGFRVARTLQPLES